ncbi:MAG TPA: metallophosphoesterase [Gemmatimonadales bacterium]|nr:metallophosphoesterase [Gemmatimonadales bacterium]
MKFDLTLGWLALVAGLTGCAGRSSPAFPVPPLPSEHLAVRVYLIGDAGAPAPGGEPVLAALSRELKGSSGERVVVFLGDNVYPRGMPAAGRRTRPEAERRLAAQIEVITSSGATGYFVLGNHDWKGEGDGRAAVTRQEQFIDSAGAGRVNLEPAAGCPGPSAVDVGRRLRLVLLDTNWWLQPKTSRHTFACATSTEPEITDSLRQAVRGAGDRIVVVAAHHPLTSGGVHGGYFGWKDHIFPLRIPVPGLWLPLPLLGSLYPAARQHGISSQDIPSPAYQRLISAMRRAFTGAEPALYAAGHEHNLQVIAGGPAGLEVVSGVGVYGHSGRAVRVKGSLFAHKASGFARLDVPWNGRPRLAVLEVNASGVSREVFSTKVE